MSSTGSRGGAPARSLSTMWRAPATMIIRTVELPAAPAPAMTTVALSSDLHTTPERVSTSKHLRRRFERDDGAYRRPVTSILPPLYSRKCMVPDINDPHSSNGFDAFDDGVL